ncbi:hypothetical protein [Mucilaginibacter gossypiicola]|nr:hypothetical protein [Mucilaginibacter gossypiicola]
MVLLFAKFDGDFDAEVLNDLILEKTGREISPSALNMTFGTMPSKFKPSYYTLNTLSIYCGYASWDDFCGLPTS